MFWFCVALIGSYIFFIWLAPVSIERFFEFSLFFKFLIAYLVFFILGFTLVLVVDLGTDSSDEDREKILEYKEQRARLKGDQMMFHKLETITVFDKLIFKHGSPLEFESNIGHPIMSGTLFYFVYCPFTGFMFLSCALFFIFFPLMIIGGILLIFEEEFGIPAFTYILEKIYWLINL